MKQGDTSCTLKGHDKFQSSYENILITIFSQVDVIKSPRTSCSARLFRRSCGPIRTEFQPLQTRRSCKDVRLTSNHGSVIFSIQHEILTRIGWGLGRYQWYRQHVVIVTTKRSYLKGREMMTGNPFHSFDYTVFVSISGSVFTNLRPHEYKKLSAPSLLTMLSFQLTKKKKNIERGL